MLDLNIYSTIVSRSRDIYLWGGGSFFPLRNKIGKLARLTFSDTIYQNSFSPQKMSDIYDFMIKIIDLKIKNIIMRQK